jgi:hypothetical protein
MALESGTYVKDLVSTNPQGTDAISQGDDHVRLIKSVLQNSFPSNSNAPIVPDISGNANKFMTVNSGATATEWANIGTSDLGSGTASATKYLRGDLSWQTLPSYSIAFSSYAIVADRKSSGTDGGTFTAGGWRQRDLNTEVADPDNIVTISSNQFILVAGTYLIKWRAPAYRVLSNISALYNASTGGYVAFGGSNRVWNSDDDQYPLMGQHRITLGGSTTFQIRQYSSATRSANGFGFASGFGTEEYTVVEIYKE